MELQAVGNVYELVIRIIGLGRGNLGHYYVDDLANKLVLRGVVLQIGEIREL